LFGGLGNAVLFSIGAAFRARGSRALYFAGYKLLQDRYKVEAIEAYGRGALGSVAIPSRRSTASSQSARTA
jgi:hypothetical protein